MRSSDALRRELRQKSFTNLLNKNFKIQKKLYKRKVLEGSIMQVAKIFQQYVEKQSH